MPVPRGIYLLMPTLEEAFPTVSEALVEQFGRSKEPAEGQGQHDPFEGMIAVLLDRELGGSGSAAALQSLAAGGLLAPENLARADVAEIRDALLEDGVSASPFLITPMKQLAQWIVEHHAGRVDALFNPDRSTDWLRGELVSIPGITLAAADAILLFALKRPSYPVDRATFRILLRHGWLDISTGYDEARELLVDRASRAAAWSPTERLQTC